MAPGNRDFKGQKHVFRKSIHKILTSQIDVGVTSTYHIQIALTTDRVIAPGRFIVNIHIIEETRALSLKTASFLSFLSFGHTAL